MLELNAHLEENILQRNLLTMLAREWEEQHGDLERSIELNMAEAALAIVPDLTPYVTGSLASAHAIYIDPDITYIAINPQATNPISPETPAEYGPRVHEMGGVSPSGHVRAFYDVTVSEYGDHILREGERTYEHLVRIAR